MALIVNRLVGVDVDRMLARDHPLLIDKDKNRVKHLFVYFDE